MDAPAPANVEFRLRPCLAADADAAYEVCLKTGDDGSDGTLLYPDDPKVLGDIFVGPYIHLEPDLAFVLEDQRGVCGYILAARDSERFYQRFVTEWLPPLRARHPVPSGDSATWTHTQKLYHELHHPNTHYPPSFRAFPSHVHIDLLPRAQGKGNGRRMMEHMLQALVARGSSGVHLGVGAVNHRAVRFYTRVGFVELERVPADAPDVIYMGRELP